MEDVKRPMLITDTVVYYLMKLLLDQMREQSPSWVPYADPSDIKDSNKVYGLSYVVKELKQLRCELAKWCTALEAERDVWDGKIKDNDVVSIGSGSKYHFARLSNGRFGVYAFGRSKYTTSKIDEYSYISKVEIDDKEEEGD